MHKLLTRNEWIWLILASLMIVAIYSSPTAVGMIRSTSEHQFGGFVFGIEDMVSYIAKMRFGARDGWQFQLIYTPEPHSGGYVYLNYLALGKLTAFLSGAGAKVQTTALIASYHIFRVLAGFLLCIVCYIFIAFFVADSLQRQLAWLFVIICGGVGWLLSLIRSGAITPQTLPIELYIPEAFSGLILMGLPHLALARSLMLAGWLVLLSAIDKGNWRLAGLASVLWFCMAVNQPFSIAVVAIVAAIWLAAVTIVEGKFDVGQAGYVVIAGILPGLYLLYCGWLFTNNPVFAVWASQNLLPSPPPIHYLLGFGILAALAIPGAATFFRERKDNKSLLLLIWPLTATILVYIPVNVQRRLLEGAIVPFSILATRGLFSMANRFHWTASGFRWVRISLVALLGLSSIMLLIGASLTALRVDWPIAHPSSELDALQWLSDHAPDDSIVFTTRTSGNILPAYSNVRVFVGHGPETVYAAEKEKEAALFYGDGMSDAQRIALLDKFRISFVWIGIPEKNLRCSGSDCFDPDSLPLKNVFTNGDYQIFEVVH